MEEISGYRFDPSMLAPEGRAPGVSAFLRTRNGAEFLEASIRSHIDHFDEIVAVYNQCEDGTDAILARLEAEFGPRLRVFYYRDRVYPLGSPEYVETPADDPGSMVNYSNFALAQTRYKVAVKLDDDHLAIDGAVASAVGAIRAGALKPDEILCFSGLNLARDKSGTLNLLQGDMFSGGGDIGFFHVSPDTYFAHDPRFERFPNRHLNWRFGGFLYWHLKYLKQDFGFGNYELSRNPASRFARKYHRLRNSALVPLSEARSIRQGWLPRLAASTLEGREWARRIRNIGITTLRAHDWPHTFADNTLEEALDRTTRHWRQALGETLT